MFFILFIFANERTNSAMIAGENLHLTQRPCQIHPIQYPISVYISSIRAYLTVGDMIICKRSQDEHESVRLIVNVDFQSNNITNQNVNNTSAKFLINWWPAIERYESTSVPSLDVVKFQYVLAINKVYQSDCNDWVMASNVLELAFVFIQLTFKAVFTFSMVFPTRFLFVILRKTTLFFY